ncbi:hypothetical protein ALC57_10607, partial [Trachymyrmex cornetzi]
FRGLQLSEEQLDEAMEYVSLYHPAAMADVTIPFHSSDVGLERLPVARILINKLPRRRITVDSNKASSPLTRGRQRHPGRGLEGALPRGALVRCVSNVNNDLLLDSNKLLYREILARPNDNGQPHNNTIIIEPKLTHDVVIAHYNRLCVMQASHVCRTLQL